ncbi:MAG: hypothetical protein ACRDCN_07895 [Tannerellaceae bacterium]
MGTKTEKTATLSRGTVLKLHSVLSKVKVNKLQQADALKLIRFMVEIKKLSAEAQEAISEMRRTCLPEKMEELEQKVETDVESLSKEERVELVTKRNAFFEKFNNASKDYLEEVTELEALKLSDDVIMLLHESNDITLDDVATLMEYLQ